MSIGFYKLCFGLLQIMSSQLVLERELSIFKNKTTAIYPMIVAKN